MWNYILGLLITGISVGYLMLPVHGFLTVGIGFMLLAIMDGLLNYLNGKK